MVCSILLAVLASETPTADWWKSFNSQSGSTKRMVLKCNTESKTEYTIGKSNENWTENWCQIVCSILFDLFDCMTSSVASAGQKIVRQRLVYLPVGITTLVCSVTLPWSTMLCSTVKQIILHCFAFCKPFCIVEWEFVGYQWDILKLTGFLRLKVLSMRSDAFNNWPV